MPLNLQLKFFLLSTTKTFILLHGFNSDGIGYKPDALRAHFKNDEIISPDLEANPQLVKTLIDDLVKKSAGDLYFIGTSLGGFYAWYFGAIYNKPAFLYNPSMRPHITLDDRGVGQFKTWTKARDYHFKASFLNILKEMQQEAKSLEKPEQLNFFLAKDDDVLDHSQLPEKYPEANFLQWYDQVGHRFATFADTMPIVEKLISNYQ